MNAYQIDCSHGNSGKIHTKQIEVAEDIVSTLIFSILTFLPLLIKIPKSTLSSHRPANSNPTKPHNTSWAS